MRCLVPGFISSSKNRSPVGPLGRDERSITLYSLVAYAALAAVCASFAISSSISRDLMPAEWANSVGRE